MAPQPDPLLTVLARAAETDDVLLSREARRLGMPRRDLEHLQRINRQQLVRGAVAIEPIRDPLRTSARAAQLAIPDGLISHRTAAHLHGLQGVGFWNPADVVDMTLPSARTRRQRRGVRLRFRPLQPSDCIQLGGLQVTSVLRTLADCAAVADRISWLSIVDSALYQKLLTADELGELADLLRRTRCADAARWLKLANGLAESPSETRVRIVLVDARLTPDHLQYVVIGDDGYPLARLDIAYRRNGKQVGLEVDSGEHDRPRALYRDRDKHNAMPALGWDVRHVIARDALRRPGYVVHQVRSALGL
jgi:hypothetical protein